MRREARDCQPRYAVKKAQPEKIRAQKRSYRRDRQLDVRGSLALRISLLGSQRGVTVHPELMLGRVADRVVKDVAGKPFHFFANFKSLVNVITLPASAVAIVEPALVIRPPARMLDPTSQIKC